MPDRWRAPEPGGQWAGRSTWKCRAVVPASDGAVDVAEKFAELAAQWLLKADAFPNLVERESLTTPSRCIIYGNPRSRAEAASPSPPSYLTDDRLEGAHASGQALPPAVTEGTHLRARGSGRSGSEGVSLGRRSDQVQHVRALRGVPAQPRADGLLLHFLGVGRRTHSHVVTGGNPGASRFRDGVTANLASCTRA